MGLDGFSWSDEVTDPRPLRILAIASGLVLAASIGVILLGGADLGAWIAAVWLLAFVATLLVIGALSGLYRQRHPGNRRKHDPAELRAEAAVIRSLQRGERPDATMEFVQQVVAGRARLAWLTWGYLVTGVAWLFLASGYEGWQFWFHLVLGTSWVGTFAARVINRERLMRGAVRWGVISRARRLTR